MLHYVVNDSITGVIEFVAGFVITLVILYFTRDLKASIDNLDRDLKDMNTRIARLEGTVYGKDIYNTIKENK